jgi:hypothetical protein
MRKLCVTVALVLPVQASIRATSETANPLTDANHHNWLSAEPIPISGA